jgi:hypothetical protein
MRLRHVLCIIAVACTLPIAGAGWQARSITSISPTADNSRVLERGLPMSPSSGAESGPVEIRIKNDSDVDFDRVRVQFPDQHEIDYGPVPRGGVTDFQATDRAYRYAGVSVVAGDQELSLQPIDFLGERELSMGRYTYLLGVEDGRLTLRLEPVT